MVNKFDNTYTRIQLSIYLIESCLKLYEKTENPIYLWKISFFWNKILAELSERKC